MKKRFVVLSVLLLLAAANSIAMSLGRHRGAALIGRPLDISVQAVLEAQDDVASLCQDADVFYADNKVDKSRIRVTAEKASSGTQDALIRIRSTTLVDEPVLTIYLRVGCQQKTERRYVILADLASEAAPDRNAVIPLAPSLQVSPPQLTAPVSAAAAANLAGAKPAKKAKKSADTNLIGASPQAGDSSNLPAPNSGTAAKRERTASKLAAATSGQANRARLKLEPLDLSIERDPQLKSSAELLSVPSSSPQERSAAAALWRAIAAQPQDILKDTEKLQNLESSVRSLQTQSQKTQQSLNELGVRLQQAESERYANALVYALVFILLLVLTGLAYLTRGQFLRRRLAGGDKPWWRKSETHVSAGNAWADSDLPVDIFGSHPLAGDKKSKPEIPVNDGLPAAEKKVNPARPDLDLSKLNSNFGSDSMPLLPSKYRHDFALSIPHASRAVKAEELFDVQQQADFFVSIGQHEQAIEVLRNHIGDDVETSALVYLDLLNLYHQLERKKDYAELREDFNRRFNTQVPVFEMYTDAGPGLDAYPSAMSRIEALWPSPKVLEVIEESIFRHPESNVEAFNLVAYRELLMLYSVAQEIISPEVQQAARSKKFDLPDTPADNVDSETPMGFLSTSVQPLSASIQQGEAAHSGTVEDSVNASTVPPASWNLGLDLDLSEPMPAPDHAAPVDVSDIEFFAQFDNDTNAAVPNLSGNHVPQAVKNATESDNLIDFDAFDSAMAASEKFKQPKG